MTCPYCHTEMELGHIYGQADKAAYWLPAGVDFRDVGWAITEENVSRVGGLIMDQAHKFFRPVYRPGEPKAFSAKTAASC